MTLEQIAQLGRKLILFLALFADCFGRLEGRALLHVYVKGQLSNLHRKTAESIALLFKQAPRTLQRFLESIKWNEEKLRNRCQQIVAEEHTHVEAIGCVDESGITKSGKETVGAARQWNGHLGKVDNCMVAVHLSYSAPGFQVLLDSSVYLPESWANDSERRKKTTYLTTLSFEQNRKLHCSKSSARWKTASVFQRGPLTSYTDVMVNSLTGSNRYSRCLWPKSPTTFMDGLKGQRYSAPHREEPTEVKSE
jgi:SRSO17 transposase